MTIQTLVKRSHYNTQGIIQNNFGFKFTTFIRFIIQNIKFLSIIIKQTFRNEFVAFYLRKNLKN